MAVGLGSGTLSTRVRAPSADSAKSPRGASGDGPQPSLYAGRLFAEKRRPRAKAPQLHKRVSVVAGESGRERRWDHLLRKFDYKRSLDVALAVGPMTVGALASMRSLPCTRVDASVCPPLTSQSLFRVPECARVLICIIVYVYVCVCVCLCELRTDRITMTQTRNTAVVVSLLEELRDRNALVQALRGR